MKKLTVEAVRHMVGDVLSKAGQGDADAAHSAEDRMLVAALETQKEEFSRWTS